jgi:hypothetical protein
MPLDHAMMVIHSLIVESEIVVYPMPRHSKNLVNNIHVSKLVDDRGGSTKSEAKNPVQLL